MSMMVKEMAGRKKFYRFGVLLSLLSSVGLQIPTASAQIDNRGYADSKALKLFSGSGLMVLQAVAELSQIVSIKTQLSTR